MINKVVFTVQIIALATIFEKVCFNYKGLTPIPKDLNLHVFKAPLLNDRKKLTNY
jgi:hypothetical protein